MSVEIVFIVDRSGSMQGSESDTIGGYHAFLAKQRAQEGATRVTTVLFDNLYELLHDTVELPLVRDITQQDYFVRGTTTLYDGLDSASQHYTPGLVRELVAG